MDQLTADQLAALAREDKGPLTKSIVIAFTVLSYVAVSLRLFARLRYIGLQLGWEVIIYPKIPRHGFILTLFVLGLYNNGVFGEPHRH